MSLFLDQQCQDEGSSFTLTKADVKANIKFPINWNQRQCLCCFRETKHYESYNNIIQMVMVTSIRLLQSFHDPDKILIHNDEYTKSRYEIVYCSCNDYMLHLKYANSRYRLL